MASTTQRYPLSTPEGSAIPLEIMKPHSFMQKSFGAVVTAAQNVPDGVEIMSITVTENCLIRFGAAAVAPVDGVNYPDTVLIEADARVCIAPKAATFTLIGLTSSGTAYVQFIEKWAGLALTKQLTGR